MRLKQSQTGSMMKQVLAHAALNSRYRVVHLIRAYNGMPWAKERISSSQLPATRMEHLVYA